MNNYIDEWNAIAARIDGLQNSLNSFLKIVEIYALYNDNQNDDQNRILKEHIIPEFESIIETIKSWNDKYDSLPENIRKLIQEFLDHKLENKAKSGLFASYNDIGFKYRLLVSSQAILPIFSLRAAVNYLLSDSEFKIRHRTELAFLHLKRSIMVDKNIRAKWNNQENGEVAVEKLGALHLLSHGIWAFKVDGAKARTDLIYQEPLDSYLSDINRSASGLVLTEWKMAEKTSELESQAKIARSQLKLYSNGVLSGIELRNTRYVVLVTTKDSNKMIADVIENNICYRHIIIATNPEVPSKQAIKEKIKDNSENSQAETTS